MAARTDAAEGVMLHTRADVKHEYLERWDLRLTYVRRDVYECAFMVP